MAENPDNTLLMEILKEIRKEVRDVRTLSLQLVDRTNRLEKRIGDVEHVVESRFGAADKSFAAVNARFDAMESRFDAMDARLVGIGQRIGDLKDDLELMIKSELMGALGNFETRIETRLDRIEKQVGVTDNSTH